MILTWSHILLFAQMHELDISNDDGDEHLQKWISLLEGHQSTTFPFLVYPLNYRTASLLASPGLESPCSFTTPALGSHVSFYHCNEVLTICISCNDAQLLPVSQNNVVSLGRHDDPVCRSMAAFATSECSRVLDHHAMYHQDEQSDSVTPAVPCRFLTAYARMKPGIVEHMVNLMDRKTASPIERVVVTGFHIGGVMAYFLAMDLAVEYDEERDFFELSKPRVVVDCVTFGSPAPGNAPFCRALRSMTDNCVRVAHVDDVASGLRIHRKLEHPTCAIYLNANGKSANNFWTELLLSIRNALGRPVLFSVQTYIQSITRQIRAPKPD